MYTCHFSSIHEKVQKTISQEAEKLMDGKAPLIVLGISSTDVHMGEPSYEAKLKLESMNVVVA
jgi:hypothetical protein